MRLGMTKARPSPGRAVFHLGGDSSTASEAPLLPAAAVGTVGASVGPRRAAVGGLLFGVRSRRLILLLFLLVRLVMADRAAAGRADGAMAEGMAGETADGGTLEATLGLGRVD